MKKRVVRWSMNRGIEESEIFWECNQVFEFSHLQREGVQAAEKEKADGRLMAVKVQQ